MDKTILIAKFSGNVFCYIALAALASLIVRVIASLMRASENQNSLFKKSFFTAFLGCGSSDSKMDDHWQTFIIGFLEISVFPILLASNKAEYIGAWFALKTLPQWGHWKDNRNIYNRFLISNALVLVLSYALAWEFLL